MVSRVEAANGAMFLVCVLLTGMIAGAAIWAVLFAMNVGISALWNEFPSHLGTMYPLIICVCGGIVIGLFTKRFGRYPENLPTVMAEVKRNGRYRYDRLGRMSVGAVLPLVFGGSVGPEAGLTGVIAALCTWVGDRFKGFGRDFKGLTDIGMYAALSAIFTAPLFGFAGVAEDGGKGGDLVLSKRMRIVVYIAAIIGAMAAMHGLTSVFGGGMSMPRYGDIAVGRDELLLLIPVCLIGACGGWLFRILDSAFENASDRLGDRDVLRAVIGGAVLGVCGMILPLTLFSGEAQTEILDETWISMGAATLIATAFVKVAATAFCVNMGWRGGHFFPVIFSGISLGYGLSLLFGIDPMFAVCASTAALVGGTMRKGLMTVLLLFLCFPLQSVPILAVGAAIGALVPAPKRFGKEEDGTETDRPNARGRRPRRSDRRSRTARSREISDSLQATSAPFSVRWSAVPLPRYPTGSFLTRPASASSSILAAMVALRL